MTVEFYPFHELLKRDMKLLVEVVSCRKDSISLMLQANKMFFPYFDYKSS